MLRTGNPECLNLLADVRAAGDTETLARQIEDYDFKSALKTLNELRKNGM